MLKKISNKIIVYNSLLIIIFIGFLVLYINTVVRDTHIEIIEREMDQKLKYIEHIINGNPRRYSINNLKMNRGLIDEISGIIDLRITIIDSDGLVVSDSKVDDEEKMDNHLYRNEIQNAFTSGKGSSIRHSTTLDTDMLYIAKKTGGYVTRIAKPLKEIDENLFLVRRTILLSGIGVILITIMLIVFISKKITGPINETISFARQFSEGDYTRRILNYSDDEIGNLQKSLNSLADTIVEKIESFINEHKKLEITIESIQDGIAVIDISRKVVIANSAFRSMLDINYEISNKIYYEAIRNSSLNSKIENALQSGGQVHFEEKLLSSISCEIFINPIEGGGSIQGILIVLHDITENRKMQKIKEELIGNMSHELKTPIAILKGYLETLYENFSDPEQTENILNKALANIERQNSLITDILKLNRLETSNNFNFETINIPSIISNCGDILMQKFERKNITLKLSLGDKECKVIGNGFLAEEVFFNLIDNAVNYNNPGGSVDINLIENKAGHMIKISDTGVGIPDDSIDRIFERFYRVDRSRSRSTGGTGLGLSIVKHAADLLNWKIEVSSGKGGTTFSIFIPFPVKTV